MFNVVVVEDEKPNLELMKILFSKNEHLNIIGEFTSAKDALINIPKLKPQVIFLDVEMPEMSGIELAREISTFDEDIEIVFVTAYEKYAIDAFKVNAVNYILKPISEDEITLTVNRLLKKNGKTKKVESKEKYKLCCLGKFRILQGDTNLNIKWPTAKTEELFSYLIYCKGEIINKWKLCEVLWSSNSLIGLEHNLHNTVYRLKSTLKKFGIYNVIQYEAKGYKLDMRNLYCDALEFEKEIVNLSNASSATLEDYEEIIALYKGNLFGDKDYFWAFDWQEKLRVSYSNLIKKVCEYYIEQKNYIRAEEQLRSLLDKDPFDEEAHELLQKVYYFKGDRLKLLRHYEQLKNMLKKELNIEPKESTKLLHKKLILTVQARVKN